MPTKKLTDLFVERTPAPARGRVEYFDAAFPGLALRVTEKGGKSWSVFYRINGRLRRFTIGRYPAIKPAQARREAMTTLERVRQGVDTPLPQAETFENVAQDYLDRHLKKNASAATYQEAKRDLEHNVLPKWRSRPIASISRRDVIDLVDGLVARGVEIQANRTLARIRALFNWAIEKDRLSVSPAAGVKPPTKERSRDRALNDDEIRWFWRSCGELGWPFGPIFKLLLLTAQRRDEVGGMRWSELDLDKRIWTLPRQRAKSDRGHELQLSEGAIDILRSLQEIAGDGRLVFTTTGKTPVSGFGNVKRRLDTAIVKARRRSLGLPEEEREFRNAMGLAANEPLPVEIPAWTLHDLRRTAATGMARLNIPPHLVDKILNHSGGTIRGVAAVYNRFAYLEERRAALEAWGRYVGGLMSPTASNVIEISAG
jgi:integrase